MVTNGTGGWCNNVGDTTHKRYIGDNVAIINVYGAHAVKKILTAFVGTNYMGSHNFACSTTGRYIFLYHEK